MWLSFRMLNWHWQWFDGWVFNVVYCSTGEGTGTRSSTLAWRIPWAEEPGGLLSMGSLRVGHDWATSLSLFTFTHWRRRWQPTPVFLPGESRGRGSLVGCRLWGRTVGHDWGDSAAAAAAPRTLVRARSAERRACAALPEGPAARAYAILAADPHRRHCSEVTTDCFVIVFTCLLLFFDHAAWLVGS